MFGFLHSMRNQIYCYHYRIPSGRSRVGNPYTIITIIISCLLGRTDPVAAITVDRVVALPVILLLLVLELLVKLVEHSDEDDDDG